MLDLFKEFREMFGEVFTSPEFEKSFNELFGDEVKGDYNYKREEWKNGELAKKDCVIYKDGKCVKDEHFDSTKSVENKNDDGKEAIGVELNTGNVVVAENNSKVIEELKRQVFEGEKHYKTLNEKYELLKDENDRLKSENDALKRKIKTLKDSFKSLF